MRFPRSPKWPTVGALLVLTFVSATSTASWRVGPMVAIASGALYTAMFGAGLVCLLRRKPMEHIVSAPAFWLVILVLMGALDQHRFLMFHNRPKFGSSAEALEVPAKLLLHGQEPYLYLVGGYPARPRLIDGPHAPLSPGPGWVILLSPLTATGLTGLDAAAVLALTVLVLSKRSRWAAGTFLLLLLAQPIFFYQGENGGDLYLISMALVTVALLLEQIPVTGRNALLLGLLAGLIATARVPILLPVAVIGFGYCKRNRRAGAFFLAASIGTALLLHGAFALWAHHNGHFYQPMHVFHRAASGSGLPSKLSVLLLLGASAYWIVRRMGDDAAGWCLGAFLVMASLFVPESIKELEYLRNLRWEGSVYFTFPVPLLIAALVLRPSSVFPCRKCCIDSPGARSDGRS